MDQRKWRQDRGQVLVMFAVLIPVLLLFFLFALGLAALLDVRAHASYSLSVATRAGARQVEYAGYGEGGTWFDARVITTTKQVFQQELSFRATGLAGTPESIAEGTEVVVGYGTSTSPWPSPFVRERLHGCPTVAARAMVPVRVWMFTVILPVVAETEVR